MYFTCPTGSLIQQHQTLLEGFCTTHGLHLPEKDFSFQMVSAMVEDCINERLLWANSRGDSHIALVEMVEGYWIRVHNIKALDTKRLIYELDRQVVNPVFYELSRLVGQILPAKTWKVVTTRPVHDTTLIHIGEDYRIVDWERRARNGEIECSQCIRQQLNL